jgi:hypothetical protein
MYHIDIMTIRKQLAANGYTNKLVAYRLGVSLPTLAAYYKNPTKIPYPKMLILAQLCGFSTEMTRRVFFAE